MHYIGVDYHKSYSYIVVKDSEGFVEQRGSVSNEKEQLQRFIEPYRPGKAVVEATRSGQMATRLCSRASSGCEAENIREQRNSQRTRQRG